VVEILSVGDPLLSFGAHMLRVFLLLDNLLLFIAAIVELVGVAVYADVFALVHIWFAWCVGLGSFLLVLSLIGILGIIGNIRCLLIFYIAINFLLGLALLVICSYALAETESGDQFIATAWQNSPWQLCNQMQVTFSCCGLESFMDAYSVFPCPFNAGTRCMDPLLNEFNTYSTEIPVIGLIVWAVLWLVALMTVQLIRLTNHAKPSEEF